MRSPHEDLDRPIQVLPIDDVIEHDADEDCFCGPTPDPVHRDDGSIGWVMIHHSLDGREFRERNQQIPAGPDRWLLG